MQDQFSSRGDGTACGDFERSAVFRSEPMEKIRAFFITVLFQLVGKLLNVRHRGKIGVGMRGLTVLQSHHLAQEFRGHPLLQLLLRIGGFVRPKRRPHDNQDQ